MCNTHNTHNRQNRITTHIPLEDSKKIINSLIINTKQDINKHPIIHEIYQIFKRYKKFFYNNLLSKSIILKLKNRRML